jgi:uncharacterized damage-inducible protein DinB
VAAVPAVAVGDRAAHGWNPPAYAALLGLAYETEAKLSPNVLISRLDVILGAAEGVLRQMPDDRMDWKPPERNRTLRDFGYHIFRLSLAFIDAMDAGRLQQSSLGEKAPDDMRESRAVANYGALVRARLSGWFEGTATSEYERILDVYYGSQSGHDLLERTVWHAAQHLRQLYALAERLGITPPMPLPVEAFRGLPLPEALW